MSDSDEIPDLSKIDQIEKNKKYIAFSQKMFMYKLNLQNINESNWIGSRIAKKNIFSMQDLRNLKFKNILFGDLIKKFANYKWRVAFFFSTISSKILKKKIKAFLMVNLIKKI